MTTDFNFYKNSALDNLNSVAFDLQLVSFDSEVQNALNDAIFEYVMQARFHVAKGLYTRANLEIARAICYLEASKHAFEHKQEWKEKLALAQAIVLTKLK